MLIKLTTLTVLYLALFTVITTPYAQNVVQVGPNVQVSKARADHAHYEIQFAADPNNARQLMACSILLQPEKDSRTTVVYMSSDAGNTWSKTLELERGNYTGDPACVYGSGGSAYFASLPLHYPGGTAEMVVYRTKGGGAAWGAPVVLPFIDREYLTVDLTGGKFQGHVYLHGTGRDKTMDPEDKSYNAVTTFSLFRSVDDGASFQQVANVPSAIHHITNEGNGVVVSDGTFVALFGEMLDRTVQFQPGVKIPRVSQATPANGVLKAVRSEDGGGTISTAIVSEWWVNRAYRRGSNVPYLAVDSGGGSFRDRLYAVWPDVRSVRTEILLSHSNDKGKTWSRPAVVNDDISWPPPAEGPDDIMPIVAVNKDGVVGVSWYDRRNSPDNMGWEERFSASLDGGDSFLPSVKVSERPYAHSPDEMLFLDEAGSNIFPNIFYFNGGDTGGMAADATGVFHPIWIDNRTGIPQIWTAPVTVKGIAAHNGSPEFAAFDDLSRMATVRYASLRYDPATSTITADACVVNTSKDTVLSAIKLRVLRFGSQVGTAEILNADSGGNGAGSVFDFSDLLEGGALKPGEQSKPKRIQFRISGFRGIREDQSQLIQLTPQFLGKAQPVGKQPATEQKPN
jgi:hypothetical protein